MATGYINDSKCLQIQSQKDKFSKFSEGIPPDSQNFYTFSQYMCIYQYACKAM